MWKKLGGIYDEYDDQIDRANQASYEIKSLEKAISRGRPRFRLRGHLLGMRPDDP